MSEILFVRHGETDANAAGIWQGWSDTHLNAVGRAQAIAVARRLADEEGHIDALYTSPLRRALETAKIIEEHLSLDAQPVEDLKEIHFGDIEGLSVEAMARRFPAVHTRWQDKGDTTFQWPGGERRGDFFERAAAACRRICRRHQEEKVVIAAHGGTIRACLADLLPEELGEWWTYTLDNAGLTRVRVTGDEAQLLTLNDTAHLQTAEDDPGAS